MINIKTMKLLIFLLSIFQLASVLAQDMSLNKDQMLQDFDQSVDHINNFAPHKDLNSFRLEIDYEKEYNFLREKITDSTTICEFKGILEKATNLVQDLHCNFMGSDYLNQYGKYQKKINFKKNQSYEDVKYFEDKCSSPIINLKLPLLYKEGKYFVYADFTYKGFLIKKGTEVNGYNNQSISEYIKNSYDIVWPVRWDDSLDSPYSTSFYKYGDNKFQLNFNDEKAPSLEFLLEDSIIYQTDKKRDITFYSQSVEQVKYFEDQQILYIGMPFMDVTQGRSIIKKIDSIHKNTVSYTKVLIDVRGNPGGNDMCWRNVLQHLLSEEIILPSNLKFKYNKPAIDYYGKGEKNIVPENIELLGNSKFWTKHYKTDILKHSKKSINFKGKIFIIQDQFIYSSASNLSNVSLNQEQLVSIGNTTDFVGGLQTEPLFIRLNNSGLVFRVEPLLDFSGVNLLNDFSHNEVEIKITPTIEDYFLRTTYNGNIYGKEFLLKHDPIIQYILKN
jgi:hypothetical protein